MDEKISFIKSRSKNKKKKKKQKTQGYYEDFYGMKKSNVTIDR